MALKFEVSVVRTVVGALLEALVLFFEVLVALLVVTGAGDGVDVVLALLLMLLLLLLS